MVPLVDVPAVFLHSLDSRCDGSRPVFELASKGDMPAAPWREVVVELELELVTWWC